jgi:ligand-binding SRPBCC domain-containing protein
MKEFTLHAELWLPRPRAQVFPFFADARNLEALTPPWLNFEVLTPAPIAMRPGALIDYRIRVHGVPIGWRTEIVEWTPPHRFVDVQLRGPYTLWHHTHTFEERDGGTLCVDDVRYRPRGGALMNWLFVRRDVEKIFQYRQQRLREMFGAAPTDPTTASR